MTMPKEVKQKMIAQYLGTDAGLSKLAQAMAAPIRQRLWSSDPEPRSNPPPRAPDPLLQGWDEDPLAHVE